MYAHLTTFLKQRQVLQNFLIINSGALRNAEKLCWLIFSGERGNRAALDEEEWMSGKGHFPGGYSAHCCNGLGSNLWSVQGEWIKTDSTLVLVCCCCKKHCWKFTTGMKKTLPTVCSPCLMSQTSLSIIWDFPDGVRGNAVVQRIEHQTRDGQVAGSVILVVVFSFSSI